MDDSSANMEKAVCKNFASAGRSYTKGEEYDHKMEFEISKVRVEVCTVSALHKNNVTKLQSSYVLEHEQKEKKASKRRRIVMVRFTFLSVLLMALSAAFLYVLHSQSVNIEAKMRDQKKLEQQLESLEKQQKRLEEEIKRLHDDDYIAELARKKYFLSKQGEIIFTVPEKK